MFDIFFGWRKASKCKKLVKRGQCQLKLLKNKRSSIARLLRQDVAELILAGHEETALNRAEQLCNDLSLVSAYELLDQFCEFILVHLSYIRKHKDIPNDINEAISSLIFASARCGDVPELRGIRKLFAERYGQRYATAAVELFPGNLVNHQIIEILSGKAVPHDVKQNLFIEIARDCSIKQDLLALEFASELQKQEKENSRNQVLDMYLLTYYNEIKGLQIQNSTAEDVEGAARSVDSLSVGNKCSSRSCQTSRQNSGITSTSINSSIVRQSSDDTSESPIYEEDEEIENGVTLDPPYVFSVQAVGQPTGRICATNSSSASESSYHCLDENMIYLDDIAEFESPKAKDRDNQDQRLFLVKPSRNRSYMNNNENVEMRTRKSKKESQISSKDRSTDLEYYIYHGELATQKHITDHNRKQQKKTIIDLESCQCSLEHPCYCCTGHEKHGYLQEDLCDNFSHGCSGNSKAKTLKVRTRPDHAVAVYDVFTYPDSQPNTKSNNTRGESSDFGSSRGSNPRKEMAAPPYRRAATMPQERLKDSSGGNIERSNSCPYKHPGHVHPKLPDYDNIAAKFMALKKDQNKVNDTETKLV